MSLIRLHGVSKTYGRTQVLRQVFFRLEKGDRVGLIGPNGCGKTTLLRLVLGRDEPDEGGVQLEDGCRIGYFSQFSELKGEQSVAQVLDGLFPEVHETEAELGRLETALADETDGRAQEKLLARQAALFERMERLDGWTYANRIDTVLSRLGFSETYRGRPIDRLSGGWRNRAALAKILLEDPSILLLDEPTNYLDLEGLAFLEQWFQALRGALVIVSHDRHFLDRTANRIVEVENFSLQEYQGNFTAYVREKPTRFKTLARQFKYEHELLALEAEAIGQRREDAKDPSNALKRRLANIKKMAQPRPVDRIVTDLYAGIRVGDVPCRAEGLRKAYDGQAVFEGLDLEVRRGDRLAVLGPNGCGKSTLLRVLTGGEEADAGRVAWSGGFAFFNRVQDELDLDETPTFALNRSPLGDRAPRRQVNRLLELMRFSEMDMRQPMGTLSGGQRARVALALALLSGAGTIVLDEPTNHLDVNSTQVMERALLHFPGAVVVVSHDRFFIDKVATRLLVFDGGGTVEVEGNWSTWAAKGEG